MIDMVATAKHLFLDVRSMVGEDAPTRDVVETQFFSTIRLSNGVSKTTSSRRLLDVDQALLGVFRKLGVSPKTFLDVAVSSGTSTLDWLESLQRAGLHPKITATDLTMTAYLVRLSGCCHVLVDRKGFPLQFDVCGLALRPWSPRRFYILGNYFLTALYCTMYSRAARRLGLLKRLEALQGRPPSADDSSIKAQVKLVTHRLRENKEIELLDDDIAEPTSPHLMRRFEVIRAANILNWSYFTAEQLRDGVKHLCERLTGPGGLLLIVRSEDANGNHGSVFRLNEKGALEVVERIGRGSEIESVVLSI